jgi:sugar/nucleoside kinase (ribokinase family)
MAIGLFIGLTTLDFIYLTHSIPKPNQKLVAIDTMNASGGPATNAAVAFRSLGNHSRLLSAIGQHPSSQMIRHDLSELDLWDLLPDSLECPPISSILVTQSTGDRAVISMNAKRFPMAQLPTDLNAAELLTGVDVLLIDGHQMAVSASIAALAQANNIPVVIDGGSWKPGFETVLSWVDYAICSANFLPPNCVPNSPEAVFKFLADFEIPHAAITRGAKSILYSDRGQSGSIEVPVIQAVDTLGAGDIFHGAFCHFILQQSFPTALANASTVAARSCEYFGTRPYS